MKASRTIMLLVLLPALLVCRAQAASSGIDEAILSTRSEIESATRELNRLRADISSEKQPLAEQIEKVDEEVAALQGELDSAAKLRRLRGERLAELEAQVAEREGDMDFMTAALREYRRAFESYAGPAESQQLPERLSPIDAALENESDPVRMLAGAARLLELSREWTRDGFDLRIIDGECLDRRGVRHAGRFAIAGPLEYFAADEIAGIAIVRTGSSLPSVFDNLELEQLAAIEGLAASGAGRVPVDVSGGNALKLRSARRSLGEHIREGGFTMYPLLAIGALSLLIALCKLIGLACLSTSDPGRVGSVVASLKAGDTDAAAATAGKIGRPLRTVILEGVEHYGAAPEQIEEMMHERVLTILPRLRRHLGALAVFGAVAPLLGLLGTVTGMIHTFQLVTIFGTGDAKMLSGGISEALVTTETGLAIAIPVLLVHAYLSRRAANMADRLEHEVVAFNADCRNETHGDSNGDD